MDYSRVFENLHSILKAASSKCKVIDEKFPSKFYEKDPNKIFDSYKKFLKSRVDSEGALKNEHNFPVTTIGERFEKKEYLKKQNSFYRLHHDVKLVCTLLIHFYPQGTRTYQMVDKFYKFATELLLRECYRLGITLTEEVLLEDQYGPEKSEFHRQISQDFIRISTAYSVPYAESYYVSSGDLDLFSSTISKSQLDRRPTEAPNSSFETNKVIPQTGDEIAPKLGFLGANVSNIPDPTLPPYEIMTKFLHPNWYAMPTTVWLQYGDFKSWAPSFNESSTVIDAGRRGTIWLEKIGYIRLRNIRDAQIDEAREKSNRESEANGTSVLEGGSALTSQPKTDVSVGATSSNNQNIPENPTPADAPKQETQNGSQLENGMDKDFKSNEEGKPDDVLGSEATNTAPTSPTIKLENLYEWMPGNSIEDDEINAFSNGTHKQLITRTLLEMARLKQERLRSKRMSQPSTRETQLYHKVQRMMKEVLLAKQVRKVPQVTARAFPVLQANYMGSIPVVRTVQTRKKKYKK
ncbi:LAME_0F17876g1_1 [Lachancea meyersii CBS 8951]|uniref:LAME_0F17876g1_1 n=1 Tax=Lachancea meyersii CBS 8951 TaxID=1266667 RepID=A0A1G4K0A1_9SACH|nr:LAME_0F17876g1_1 [Lachancea meyersii CBS 8951]